MIRVEPPRYGDTVFFTWCFKKREEANLFGNQAEAITFLQGCGLKDSEIREFRFVEVE